MIKMGWEEFLLNKFFKIFSFNENVSYLEKLELLCLKKMEAIEIMMRMFGPVNKMWPMNKGNLSFLLLPLINIGHKEMILNEKAE